MTHHTDDTALAGSALSADAVAHYLETHADFFHHRAELLARLSLPSKRGGAVSLVERQLELLRERNQHLETQLRELIDVARQNEQLSWQMHRLAVSLQGVQSLDALLDTLFAAMAQQFAAEHIAILLRGRDLPEHDRLHCYIPTDERLAPFAAFLHRGRVVCGRSNSAQLQLLFAEAAPQIKSAAFVPVQLDGSDGLLALGSQHAEQFTVDKGEMFLQQLGALLSAALQRFVADDTAG